MAETSVKSLKPLESNELATSSAVTLDSYTSSWYEFPSDGYLVASASASSTSKSIAYITGNGEHSSFSIGGWSNGTYGQWGVFVRKGMKAKVRTLENSGHLTFYPLS